MPLRARAASVWRRLRGGELTAWRAAASVAVGLAIGVTPLWGVHFLLVIAVCVPLRLDAPVAYLAANISIPPMAPLLLLAEVEIGSLVLTGHWMPTSPATLRASGAFAFVREVAVGTALFSPLMGILGGVLTWVAARLVESVHARRDAESPLAEADLARAIDRVANRYASDSNRAAYHYVRAKLASDPVAERVVALGAKESFGVLLDAGCGRGQLGVLLLERGLAAQVTGFDWDAAKIAAATAASTGLPASYRVGDLRDSIEEPADTVLLIDALHYLTDDEQDAALAGAARAARRTLVIRELDPGRGWRSTVTRWQEGVTTALRYNRGARVNARPIAALTRPLEAAGFTVDVTPCWGKTPLSNVLIVARRIKDDASSLRTNG